MKTENSSTETETKLCKTSQTGYAPGVFDKIRISEQRPNN